jgi:hypothetical protein
VGACARMQNSGPENLGDKETRACLALPGWVENSCDWSHKVFSGATPRHPIGCGTLYPMQLSRSGPTVGRWLSRFLCHLSRYHGPGLVLVLGPSCRAWECFPNDGKLESTPAPRKREW